MPMMKAVFDMVKETEIPVRVSLETLMLDGIGMCGACRVTHFGKVKFACADGPEFDAYGLDFADILNRQKAYKSKEIEAEEYCKCKNDNR
jgi:ferredoxin--NADP+ reductase